MSERATPASDRLPPRHPAQGFDLDPLAVLEEGHRCHGPVFRTVVDRAETVLVGTWAGLDELVAVERGHLEVLNTALVHDLFGRALFNLVDADHAQARRRLRPALSIRAQPSYVPALLEVAALTVSRWTGDGVADLPRAARALTQAMSIRVLLNIWPGETAAATFTTQFTRFVAATAAPAGRRRFATTRYWAGRRARQELQELLVHRATTASTGSALPELAAAFADAPAAVGPLADHLLAMLIAAQETTASLISWAVIELTCHPQLAAHAAEEARAAVAVPDLLVRRDALPVLRALLAETLRVHSPNLLSMRSVVQPVELGGYPLPVGTRVAYSPSTGHFDPASFPQPRIFRPNRFLMDPAAAARLVGFGRGAHACLGRSLAELMVRTAIAVILRAGRPCLPAGPPGRVRYRPAKNPLGPVPLTLNRHEALS